MPVAWLQIENLKYTTKKLLELIKELSKVAGYEVNIWKSVAFLYTNNELSEREIKKTIQLIGQWIKYLETNLIRW